ncbi:hypothetical protein JTB14_015505 [Gonioctena quinquepunctata]|nr:hypothetical protein JTB14_015505 [Gonioctena quinquepunctata]
MATNSNSIIFIIVCTLISNGISFSIDNGDPLVKLNKGPAGYKLNMPENNHDTDHRRALFTIHGSDASLQPNLEKDPGFEYSIEKTSDDQWTFYSLSSFDFETQLHYYVFDLFFGENYKTLTLLVDNTDDEAPTLTCPNDFAMLEGFLYDVTYTPCICILSDPDGFLSQTSFSIEDNVKFEFVMYGNIPDNEQSTTVMLINKVKLEHEETFTVIAKDGAGHNTVPEANISIVVQVLGI